MEKKMMMPANYNIMTEEEMVYTDGGWTPHLPSTGNSFADGVIYFSLAAISVVNGLWSSTVVSDFVKAHKGSNVSGFVNEAIDQYSAYIQKDVKSAVVGVYSAVNQISGWWILSGVLSVLD